MRAHEMSAHPRVRATTTILLALLGALLTTGCAGTAADTATAPAAKADLQASGTPFTVCIESCVFEGEGANLGLGCANDIRGTTEIQSESGEVLWSVNWTVDHLLVVHPGQTFLYGGCCFDDSIMKQTIRYVTQFEWNDLTCPAS